MKNKTVVMLLVVLTTTVLLFTGCGKKENDTAPVVSEAVEEIEETEPVEKAEVTEDIETTEAEPVEEESVAEDIPLTQEEIDKLNSEATTDAQKEALEAYEALTKNGTWTDAYGVTYTKVVGKPDGSFRRMSDAEAENVLATADQKSDEYYYAQAELQGKDWVKYDTVGGVVYYDPYEYEEAMQSVVERLEEDSVDDHVYTYEEMRELIGDDGAFRD